MATQKPKQQTPRARQEGLLHTSLNNELVIYDTERNKAHSLNHIASLVWRHCDGQTAVSQILKIVAQELRAPVDEQVVWLALQQLGRNQLLEERVQTPINLISRREAARRFGKVAVMALPIVTSMLIPPAIAANSGGLPNGSMCSSNSQCISGCCSGMICQPASAC